MKAKSKGGGPLANDDYYAEEVIRICQQAVVRIEKYGLQGIFQKRIAPPPWDPRTNLPYYRNERQKFRP